MLVRTLSILECTKLLTANRIGHLACAKDGQPYVVPLYYAHADNHLYAFSLLGKKIDWMRSNPLVSVRRTSDRARVEKCDRRWAL